MPAKKKSSARSLAMKKVWARKRAAGSARTKTRRCGLDRAIRSDGRCTTRVPCYDGNGHVVPYTKRGPDGQCRLIDCGKGKILDPKTGECISTSSSRGKKLFLAKQVEDADRLVKSYKDAWKKIDKTPPTYYDQFDKESGDMKTKEDRREKMRQQIKKRQDKLEKKRIENMEDSVKLKQAMYYMDQNMKRGNFSYNDAGDVEMEENSLGKDVEKRYNPQSAGASFSYY